MVGKEIMEDFRIQVEFSNPFGEKVTSGTKVTPLFLKVKYGGSCLPLAHRLYKQT